VHGRVMMRSFAFAVLLPVAALAGAGAASAAAPGLPRTYQVQKVDSPTPAPQANFGLALVSAGDVNGDGKPDLLVGTDEHGGSLSPVHVISSADGSLIRSISAPDPDPGSPGNSPAGFGSYVGKLPDIGSCTGGTAGQPCPNNPSGAPDGIPEMLVTALGVDVPFTRTDTAAPATLVDAGRAYVIDGATGAVLKKLQMPAADLTDQLTAPGGAKKPAFGRTILNPSSSFGPSPVNLSGPTAPSAGVLIGDVNGGGKPDILVGASDYFETGATANPDSTCAGNPVVPSNQCLQAGREYVFYGETLAPTPGGVAAPATPDDTPDQTIKNPAAQPDDPTTPANTNRENMGYSIAPVGDVGSCTVNPGPGRFCPNASSSGILDGKPDYALSSHRTDDFGMFDVGVVHLIDGATGSVLYTYHHPEPQPASIFGFTNYNQPAVGDMGSGTAVDVYEPAMRQNNPYTGGGRGYAMNGNFKQSGSPNSVSFATFNDPTPAPSENFGTSSAGIGDVVGFADGLDGRTEIMIGDYGPHNPGTNQSPINDVMIMSALNEQVLQKIDAPDQQPGAGFGTALAPLGDINGDGFQDYAIGAGLLDVGANPDQGRIYILRSDNSPAPPAPPPTTPPAGPTGPAGPAGPQGGTGPTATIAGRTLELVSSAGTIRRGRRVSLRGALDAFANPSACQNGQVVEIQRRSAHSPVYHTFARRTTDANGAFLLRAKPRSTTVYRARVAQSEACLGAASGGERVTVRRPAAR
jgi:hypothetical protein